MAKIVIIDDEAPILDLMTKLCRKMGHEAFAYQTGREGLAAMPTLRPDLAIVDLRIGDMDGLQVIETCRREFPGINVVMVTGFGSVENGGRGDEAGSVRLPDQAVRTGRSCSERSTRADAAGGSRGRGEWRRRLDTDLGSFYRP